MAPQREWFEKDYYRVLGVSDTASQKDVKSAYRELSRQYHHDTNSGDKGAEERVRGGCASYGVIGGPEKRKEYDEVRKLGPVGGMFGGAPGGGGGTGGVRFEGMGDIGDMLGGLFGRGRRGGGAGGGRGRGRPRGGGRGGGTGGFRFEAMGDIGDMLGGLFGRGRRGGGSAAGRGTGPHRGQDLEAELHLDFEDAVRGLTTTIHLTSGATWASGPGG